MLKFKLVTTVILEHIQQFNNEQLIGWHLKIGTLFWLCVENLQSERFGDCAEIQEHATTGAQRSILPGCLAALTIAQPCNIGHYTPPDRHTLGTPPG